MVHMIWTVYSYMVWTILYAYHMSYKLWINFELILKGRIIRVARRLEHFQDRFDAIVGLFQPLHLV